MKKIQGRELSEFLNFILRHKPETIKLDLDEYGYASIEKIISNSLAINIEIEKKELLKLVKTNDKKRFVINKWGKLIKATQGHSFPVKLEIPSVKPPEILYHGTLKTLTKTILNEGIKRMKRSHVHMNSAFTKSYIAGGRTSKEPAVLMIQARKMFNDNYSFYPIENNVWLTDFVPPEYIREKKINEEFDLDEVEIELSTTFQKINPIEINQRNDKRKLLRIQNMNCFICKAEKSLLEFKKDKVICTESTYERQKIRHYMPGQFESNTVHETKEIIKIIRRGKIQYESKSTDDLVNSIKKMKVEFEGTGLWYNCNKCGNLNFITNSSTENEVFKCSTCKINTVKQVGQSQFKINIKNNL